MAISPNIINSNFLQIAVTDAIGNVTGVSVANAASLQVGGGSNLQALATDGSGTLSWSPVKPTYSKVVKMSTTGFAGMLTLMDDGRLYITRSSSASTYDCWYDTVRTDNVADGYYGAEATHEILKPDTETGKIIDADTYAASAYMLMDNGNLYTWGYNAQGQLGVGDRVNRFTPTLAATTVTNVYVDNTSSNRSSAYVRLVIKKADGKIYGCGYNAFGQLGVGNLTDNFPSFTEITAAGLNPKSVWNLGNYLGCLVIQKADNSVVVCGYNGYGQLGNGTGTNMPTMTAVPGWQPSSPTMILKKATGGFGYGDSSSYNQSTLIMWFSDGTTDVIKACGSNNWAALANGNTTDATTPVTVTLPTTSGTIKQFSVAGAAPLTAHVLYTNGDLFVWGYNGQGQAGIGYDGNIKTVTKVATDVISILSDSITPTATYEYHNQTFIQKADGYYAAGRSTRGECGTGTITDEVLAFTRILLPEGIAIEKIGKISSGNDVSATYVVDQYGRWWAWGGGGWWAITNQKGNGSLDTYPSPYRVNPYNILWANGWAGA